MSRRVSIALAALAIWSCAKPVETQRACTPPRSNWVKPHCLGCGLEVPGVSFQIDHNSKLYQDGEPISFSLLEERLKLIGKIDNPWMAVHLETEMGADCALVDRVRDQFEAHLQCGEFGQCAEGNKAIWRKIPVPPGTPPS